MALKKYGSSYTKYASSYTKHEVDFSVQEKLSDTADHNQALIKNLSEKTLDPDTVCRQLQLKLT